MLQGEHSTKALTILTAAAFAASTRGVMGVPQATIHYLGNSGVAVDTPKHFLVFDYYLDETPGRRVLDEGVITPRSLPEDKSIIVFVSHNHADHFNPVIFKWKETRPNITYILSDDVRTQADCKRIAKDQTLALEDGVSIKAYDSTDAGVCFLVQVDGLTIFHAGDYNLWHWQDESTPKEVQTAKAHFLKILRAIQADQPSIDLSFFPVDPRIGRAHDAGAAFFCDKLRPALTTPMHFGDQFDVAAAYGARTDVGKVFAPNKRGDRMVFSKEEAAVLKEEL